MKRAFAWLAGLVGIAALGRLLSRRSTSTPPPSAGPQTAADPAAELRQRLAAQRETETTATPRGTTEPPDGETLDERRARVHAKAQEAIDAMREPQP